MSFPSFLKKDRLRSRGRSSERQFLIKNPFIIRAVKAGSKGVRFLTCIYYQLKTSQSSMPVIVGWKFAEILCRRPINDTSLRFTHPWSSARDNFPASKETLSTIFSQHSLNHPSVAFDVEIMNRLVDFFLLRSINKLKLHVKLRAVG